MNDYPSQLKIGWIGTGVMGQSMAGHLLGAGHELTVMNRTPAKAQKLVDEGAKRVSTPSEAAEGNDVVFTMVGYPDDVREVYLGEDGILSRVQPDAIMVDLTTSSPELAAEIYSQAKAKNGSSIDAPVSGGDIGARNAALSIMVGGDQDAVERVMPLFEKMGKTIVHHGPAGAGQNCKMVNQILVAGTMVSVCESLIFAAKSGLDPTTVLKSVGGGAATSWTLVNLGPRIISGDDAPGFYVEHFLKDMRIALEQCERMNLQLPGLELCRELYQRLSELGHHRSGTQALIHALSSINELSWPPSTSNDPNNVADAS
ncbi:MAG: NAD(P)-dependent oxidoreductase [Planctomycetota bacterium]